MAENIFQKRNEEITKYFKYAMDANDPHEVKTWLISAIGALADIVRHQQTAIDRREQPSRPLATRHTSGGVATRRVIGLKRTGQTAQEGDGNDGNTDTTTH